MRELTFEQICSTLRALDVSNATLQSIELDRYPLYRSTDPFNACGEFSEFGAVEELGTCIESTARSAFASDSDVAACPA